MKRLRKIQNSSDEAKQNPKDVEKTNTYTKLKIQRYEPHQKLGVLLCPL